MTGDDEHGERRTPDRRVLFDLDDDSSADELVRDAAPRPGLIRWSSLAVAVVVVLSVVGTSVYRSAQREHQRVAYDKLLALSADGEKAVADAVSRTRDVVQYSEPLLNISRTTPATRTALMAEVVQAAKESRAGIETQRRRLAAASAPGKLRAARDAAVKYLADWAAVFASASGERQENQQNDLLQEQTAANQALQAAAPDKGRAAQAAGVLGTLGW